MHEKGQGGVMKCAPQLCLAGGDTSLKVTLIVGQELLACYETPRSYFGTSFRAPAEGIVLLKSPTSDDHAVHGPDFGRQSTVHKPLTQPH